MSEPFIIRVETSRVVALQKKYYLTGKNGEQLPFCLEDPDKVLAKRWYFNGEFHREDGPATEDKWGREEWYLNGKSFGPTKPDNWDELVELARIERVMTE